MQNGFIERFNGSYRRGVLDMYAFRTLSEIRERTEHWLRDYNETIPHDALNDLTPAEFRQIHQPGTSSYAWTYFGGVDRPTKPPSLQTPASTLTTPLLAAA